MVPPESGDPCDKPRYAEAAGKSALSLRGSELRDAEAQHGSLVAHVDVVCRSEYSSFVPVSVGRGDCAEGRHVACLRRAVRAEVAVAVHGECAGKYRETGRLGGS